MFTSSFTKFEDVLLDKLSLKYGNLFSSVKFGIKVNTSFLSVSKFDKFSFLLSFLRLD